PSVCQNAGWSQTTASIAASAITDARCSVRRSGGQSSMRRAVPSSSNIASAAVSWLAIAISTDRPASSAARPARIVPVTRSETAIVVRGSESVRPAALARRWSRSFMASAQLDRDVFVGLDEVAERLGEVSILGGGERIDAELVLEASDQNRKAQRIEPR